MVGFSLTENLALYRLHLLTSVTYACSGRAATCRSVVFKDLNQMTCNLHGGHFERAVQDLMERQSSRPIIDCQKTGRISKIHPILLV